MKKKRLVTGITPTGVLTIGNYLGTIQSLVKMQNDYEMFVFVADLHSLSQNIVDANKNIKNLRQKTYDILKLYLACGIKPKNVNLFIQSDIMEHTFLGFLLQCSTTIGRLNRMTQFKEKIKTKKQSGISTGLLTYPCLMSADIMLYQPDIVPVGIDQKQHIELCRDLTLYFNKKYNLNLKLPIEYINKVTFKILNLIEPNKKMSKSSLNENSFISLLDTSDNVSIKIKKALTDCENKVYFNMKKKPGISNLMNIYSGFSNYSIAEIEKKYKNSNYGDFKKDLIMKINKKLTTIQKKFNSYTDDKINKIVESGKNKAQKEAKKFIKKIKDKIRI